MKNLTWVEVSKDALLHNMREFRKIIGDDVILCPCVKGNAYGHGIVGCGKIFVEAGADWLGVNSLYEARSLRDAGIDSPIYILGYVGLDELDEAVKLDCRLVVYNRETIDRLAEICNESGKKAQVHMKVETGNNRQGVLFDEILDFAQYIVKYQNLILEGISTHFANIEDTTDHTFAHSQLSCFKKIIDILEDAGISIKIKHCANSAATLIMSDTHFNMVRPGISSYGMWPSKETYLSYLQEVGNGFDLKPAFTWKTKIAQIKTISAGSYVGYGCTYRTSHDTKLAALPIGYYDGYDRCLNGAYVLINGKRAFVRGRVCMNIIMVDITDIPDAKLENEVVLIGKSADDQIYAEDFATWMGTINYEVTTRVNERIPRVYV